ncbi:MULTISPECIES: trans-aconitate 2-methyltransferase [unclassified Curtobacterium]|uniref:class I SAM-dependent methyltransferase n=1 Tax=unclassified Curtobacterium TaxID=257496 RepID=UPI000DA716F5|nr:MULTISPECIES: class I SAM-dependent methyltransferase [unclassified Curtobacterium]PZF38647.1 class I SAM-dependent methyltransferase [Curtobacterium sp. MCLR17_053]PZF45623.1 class I SAM-dependent methyltransferase [Curtobacterium sp. MCLR17_051]
MTTTTATPTAAETEQALALLASWDTQQAAYITHREQRFAVMLDVVDHVVPRGGVVLDLASGPGSISQRIIARRPDVTCIAVDYDPVLLELGRTALAGQPVRFVDADLWDRDWTTGLDGVVPDAVLSSTALHWLPSDVLSRVYNDLGSLLAPGGVVMNADHLRHLDGRTLFAELSDLDDVRTQQTDRAAGALDWDQWFAEVTAVERYGRLVAERERRFEHRPPNPELSLDFHVAALEVAGFAEVGPVWQYLDDFVVLARR